MNNIEILKKKIIYRSEHRGSKEMDILLGSFVKKYINTFSKTDLIDLEKFLNIKDETLYKWYLNQSIEDIIPINNVSTKFKSFRL